MCFCQVIFGLEFCQCLSFQSVHPKNKSSNKMSAVGHSLSKSVFVVAAKRTPFGTFGGALKSFTPTDLQVHGSA